MTIFTSSPQQQKPMREWALWMCSLGLVFIDQCTVRLHVWRLPDLSSWRFWANQFLSVVFVYGLLVLLAAGLQTSFAQKRPWLRRWLLAANAFEFILLLTVQINHFLIYQKPFSSFSVRFLIENPRLTFELAQDNIQWSETLIRLAPGALLCIVSLKLLGQSARQGRMRRIGGAFAFIASLMVATFAWFSAPLVQHSFLSASVAFADILRIPDYTNRFSRRQQQKFIPRVNCVAPLASQVALPPQPPPSVVWIVGESAVASRFSIYGNKRVTTPFLLEEYQKGRLIPFQNAVSIGTVTRVSVPYLFFGLQGPDDVGEIFQSPSVFDFAKAVGMNTAFIGAQELRWGNQDKIIINSNVDLYRSGTDFDRNAGVSKGADDIEVLNRGAVPYLEQVSQPFFLALHMDGSHYPYAKHSHPRYKKFLPELDPNDLNAYDNTLVQLDAYLQELMTVVRRKHPTAWVFYSSDHGQNISQRLRFHGSYTEDVIRNPLFIFPPVEGNSVGRRVQKLRAQTASPVSQADLFASTLDLWGCGDFLHSQQESSSLFRPIPSDRLRVISGLMSSHFVDQTFAVVNNARQIYEIDWSKGVVTLPDGNSLKIESWKNQRLRSFVSSRRKKE